MAVPPPSTPTSPAPPSPESVRNSPSCNPSLLTIAAIVAIVVAVSTAIHQLLRFLSRRDAPVPLIHHQSSSSFSSGGGDSVSSRGGGSAAAHSQSLQSDLDRTALIDSLQIFTLASGLAARPKSSPDCAVCLAAFRPDEDLRLLPACRHAFHAACIGAWIRSTPSCPLCRSAVVAVPSSCTSPPTSFRFEIGTVSRRRNSSIDPDLRSYSIGSSFEYVVEEEVAADVARVRRREKEGEIAGSEAGVPPPPPPPGEEIAEIAGASSRGWLRDYLDRFASSRISSFRFSSRSFDRTAAAAAVAGDIGVGVGHHFWDLEGNESHAVEQESGYFYSLYRWLLGAPS